MVSTRPKKVEKKVQRDRKKVVHSVTSSEPEVKFAEEAPIAPTTIPVSGEPTTISVPVAHKPKPDYKQLLTEAPPVPYFSKMEDAVEFVDEYARWKSRVKAAA